MYYKSDKATDRWSRSFKYLLPYKSHFLVLQLFIFVDEGERFESVFTVIGTLTLKIIRFSYYLTKLIAVKYYLPQIARICNIISIFFFIIGMLKKNGNQFVRADFLSIGIKVFSLFRYIRCARSKSIYLS